jgi:hypothetical protein
MTALPLDHHPIVAPFRAPLAGDAWVAVQRYYYFIVCYVY